MKRVKSYALSWHDGYEWRKPKRRFVVYERWPKSKEEILATNEEAVLVAKGKIGDIIYLKTDKHRIEDIEWELTPEERRRRDRIQEIAAQRQVTRLVHFTRLSNVESILSLGLLSVQDLNKRNIPFLENDTLRLDGYREAISLSVSFPNYMYFYRKRQELEGSWAVLELAPEILWQKDCAFCVINAAAQQIRALSLEELKDPESFAKMFGDCGISRDRLAIPNDYPTNPQAEVLVFENIEPSYIKRIAVPSKADAKNIKTDIPMEVDPTLFSPRCDYAHWRNDNDGF